MKNLALIALLIASSSLFAEAGLGLESDYQVESIEDITPSAGTPGGLEDEIINDELDISGTKKRQPKRKRVSLREKLERQNEQRAMQAIENARLEAEKKLGNQLQQMFKK